MAKRLIKLEKYHCRYCGELDKHLKALDLPYEVHNMDDKPEKAVEYGVMSAPVLILEDEKGNVLKQVNGFFRDQIDELIEEYKKEA